MNIIKNPKTGKYWKMLNGEVDDVQLASKFHPNTLWLETDSLKVCSYRNELIKQRKNKIKRLNGSNL